MLILQIYDYLTGYYTEKTPYMINFAKIIYNLMGLCQNIIAAYIYFIDQSIDNCKDFAELVFFVCILDTFFIFDNVVYIHHALLFAMYFVYKTYNLDLEDNKDTFMILLSTELSTILLSARNIISLTGYFHDYHMVVSVLFAVSFIYFRIYRYSIYVYDHIGELILPLQFAMLFLLGLNTFWSTKIIQKGYTEIFSQKLKNT